MGVCQEVRSWITGNVVVPVVTVITAVQEFCQEIGQWVEEEITKPVEHFFNQVQEFCDDLPWPLDWACDVVTVVVKVVEWVVETVVKWVVTIVCQLVTTVLGIIIEFIVRVIAWLVTFVVCIFTDFLDALKSIYDLWGIVLDLIDDVFQLIDTLLDDVIGILDDLDRLMDSIANSLGWLGIIFGIIKGVIGFVRHIVEIVKDIVKAIDDIVVGILSLNPCRILRGIADLGLGIGRALADTGFVVLFPVRAVGWIVGGVRDSVVVKMVRDMIEKTINGAFGAGSERAGRAFDKVNLDSRSMGLPFHADARRMFLSSKARSPDLRALHNGGVINLHALAGYISGCDRTFNEADSEVVYAGTHMRVAYVDIDTFLNDGPDSVPEFHVFPITRTKFVEHLECARKKARYLGIQLNYGSVGTLQISNPQWIPLAAGETDSSVQDAIFRDVFGRNGTVADDLSTLPSVSLFHYVLTAEGKELFGLTSWFRPSSGQTEAKPSGVTYRNRSPNWVLRWVLAHEMGHYWGLDHNAGVRGLDEIMYTPKDGISINGSTVYEYLLAGGEPRFTFDDAKTTWAWITGDAAPSLLP